uniref:RING-type domain-containing protein n=1 Tax=Bionectria ochroleuca TaxID=29856 RepID=A0A8H7K851_BIOOC
MYCHIKTCSAFIPPSSIQGDKAVCNRCNCSTCTRCKGLHHAGACPADPATQEFLRIAKDNGWQSCQSCHRMVELSTGCHHITCVCKHHFCYACGVKWKSCECPQWDEQRLLGRANVIVNRDAGAAHHPLLEYDLEGADLGDDTWMDNLPPPPSPSPPSPSPPSPSPPPPPPTPPPLEENETDQLPNQVSASRAGRVLKERANLIQNHECRHEFWNYRRGEHECEVCGDALLDFTAECIQCKIMACRRCRFNRL